MSFIWTSPGGINAYWTSISTIIQVRSPCISLFSNERLVNLDRMYEFSCDWNYRPDHCIYENNCHQAAKDGIKILHGCRSAFHNEKYLEFRSIYQVIAQWNFDRDVKPSLLTPIQANLELFGSTNCGKSSSLFTKHLSKEISSLAHSLKHHYHLALLINDNWNLIDQSHILLKSLLLFSPNKSTPHFHLHVILTDPQARTYFSQRMESLVHSIDYYNTSIQHPLELPVSTRSGQRWEGCSFVVLEHLECRSSDLSQSECHLHQFDRSTLVVVRTVRHSTDHRSVCSMPSIRYRLALGDQPDSELFLYWSFLVLIGCKYLVCLSLFDCDCSERLDRTWRSNLVVFFLGFSNLLLLHLSRMKSLQMNFQGINQLSTGNERRCCSTLERRNDPHCRECLFSSVQIHSRTRSVSIDWGDSVSPRDSRSVVVRHSPSNHQSSKRRSSRREKQKIRFAPSDERDEHQSDVEFDARRRIEPSGECSMSRSAHWLNQNSSK